MGGQRAGTQVPPFRHPWEQERLSGGPKTVLRVMLIEEAYWTADLQDPHETEGRDMMWYTTTMSRQNYRVLKAAYTVC